eukprot:5622175-Lingulodinium_polyedra.AAC.1
MPRESMVVWRAEKQNRMRSDLHPHCQASIRQKSVCLHMFSPLSAKYGALVVMAWVRHPRGVWTLECFGQA